MIFCVEADNRIVSCKAVFDNQGCNRSLRIHGEEHIVAHTEADDDVDIGLGLVQKLSLKEGIAPSFKFLRVNYLVFRRHAQFAFIHCPTAANCGANLESVFFNY